MRKYSAILLTLLLCVSLVSGQTIAKSNEDLKPINFKVEVTKPKKGAIYKEGDPLHIRWKSNHTGVWVVSLFRDDTNKVTILTGSEQHLGALHQMMADIPKGVSAYPFRKFKVKVGTLNSKGKISGWSQLFVIKAPQSVISYGEHPAEKGNCGVGKHVTYEWMGTLDDGGTAPTHKKIPGRVRVGFENHYTKNGAVQWAYLGYVFRGWIKFDLSKLEGIPGILTKAELIIDRSDHFTDVSQNWVKSACNNVYRLNAAYSNSSCLSLPGESIASLPVDGPTHWKIDIKTTVRNWLNHPETNFGLLLIPFNENYEQKDFHAVSYYKTKLVIDYVEAKK